MYICQRCNAQVKANKAQIKVVTETRPKYYGNSQGYETVKEVAVCEDCAEELRPNK